MELVLVKSPQRPDEEIFHLKLGANTLGSSKTSDLSVDENGILPHHLTIEYTRDRLILSTNQPGAGFFYQGRSCEKAVIRPGETFSIEHTIFYCTAASGPDPTQHATYG